MGKGGKFLNPADKARKEARKKELKKNKKQRQQVRSEAIERRNPEQIIAELESLDKQEYDPNNRPAQSAIANMEQLYKDKRKKLKALFDRILAYYQKEDQEKYAQLKKMEAEYEVKHKKLEKQFKSATEPVKLPDVIPPTLADPTKPPPLPMASCPSKKPPVEPRPVIRQPRPPIEPPRSVIQPPKPVIDPKPPVIESRPVIESKPVIFLPKVTKFVPASVRTKIGNKPSAPVDKDKLAKA